MRAYNIKYTIYLCIYVKRRIVSTRSFNIMCGLTQMFIKKLCAAERIAYIIRRVRRNIYILQRGCKGGYMYLYSIRKLRYLYWKFNKAQSSHRVYIDECFVRQIRYGGFLHIFFSNITFLIYENLITIYINCNQNDNIHFNKCFK